METGLFGRIHILRKPLKMEVVGDRRNRVTEACAEVEIAKYLAVSKNDISKIFRSHLSIHWIWAVDLNFVGLDSVCRGSCRHPSVREKRD